MTSRAKPIAKRHRGSHESDHRRQVILNIFFSLVVILALLILAGAAAASYYGDHFAALATVSGQGISKDEYRTRAAIETWRLDYAEARIRSQQQANQIDSSVADQQLNAIAQARSNLSTQAIEDLIDLTLKSQLAGQQGVTVTDQQIDAQIAKEATTPENRHLWVIGFKPEVSSGATTANDAQKATAKANANQALADLRAGQTWETVAARNPDDVYSSKGGEIGWISADDTFLDPAFQAAEFSLQVGQYTDVIEGADGEYRIGRVTEIVPQSVDQAFQQKIKDAGISIDSYRAAERADAISVALSDKIVASVVDQPSVQRRLSEIFLAVDPNATPGVGDEVQVRHILFSPKNDPQGAQTLPSTDPAWAAAEAEANAAYQTLVKDPSQFATLAKTDSDDTNTAADGGLLPYTSQANFDPAFGKAAFAPGLQPNQILPPVKSAFGWHIIQFVDRRPQPSDRINTIAADAAKPDADFAALAKANSGGATAADGGDIGWVAHYQLDSARDIAIFKADIGGLTQVIQEKDGYYLYKVTAEQTRLPDADQISTLKASAFSNWYDAIKLGTRIERFFSTSSATNTVPGQ